MGEILLDDINIAKEGALNYLKQITEINSESEFCFAIIVLMQLINCLLFRVNGNTAKLTSRNIQGLTSSHKLQSLFDLRNAICHLYNTERYTYNIEKVSKLFENDLYSGVLEFIQDIVESIEDNTFMDKYGIQDKKSALDIMASHGAN